MAMECSKEVIFREIRQLWPRYHPKQQKLESFRLASELKQSNKLANKYPNDLFSYIYLSFFHIC